MVHRLLLKLLHLEINIELTVITSVDYFRLLGKHVIIFYLWTSEMLFDTIVVCSQCCKYLFLVNIHNFVMHIKSRFLTHIELLCIIPKWAHFTIHFVC